MTTSVKSLLINMPGLQVLPFCSFNSCLKGKSKENIKTYKKALRNDLVSDSKAPAVLRGQSFWHSHLTTVRMQGDHSDCVRPHIFHQKFPPLSQFTTTKHHSCTQYLQTSSVYGLLLLATTWNTDLRSTAVGISRSRATAHPVGHTQLATLPAECWCYSLWAQPGKGGEWAVQEGQSLPRLGGCSNRMPAASSLSGQIQRSLRLPYPQETASFQVSPGPIRLGAERSTGPARKHVLRLQCPQNTKFSISIGLLERKMTSSISHSARKPVPSRLLSPNAVCRAATPKALPAPLSPLRCLVWATRRKQPARTSSSDQDRMFASAQHDGVLLLDIITTAGPQLQSRGTW